MKIVLKIRWCVLFISICCGSAIAEGVHHYVFFNRDREKISDPAFLNTKAFEGAQLKYTWRELEPGKDAYDFNGSGIAPGADPDSRSTLRRHQGLADDLACGSL